MDRLNNIQTIPEEGPTADVGPESEVGSKIGRLIDVDGDTIATSTSTTSTTTKTTAILTTPTPTTISATSNPDNTASRKPMEKLITAPLQSIEQSSNDTPMKDTLSPAADGIEDHSSGGQCDKCGMSQNELHKLRAAKEELETEVNSIKTRLELGANELEREVQRRVDLEQQFTEEAKRTTDQIEELIAKSDRDDAKLAELKKKFELYSRETSSMIESFTTNREILTSHLLELRKENDFLLAKYMGKARDLQSEEINLPQSVEELQFHCLTLNEKLILATLAKERLEETLASRDSNNSPAGSLIDQTTASASTPTTS